MKYIILIAGAVCLLSCSEQHSDGKSEEVFQIDESTEKELIEVKIKQFSEHVIDGNFKAVGEMYTEDSRIFPSGMDIIKGRDAVTEYWDKPRTSSISYHKVSPEEIKIWGDEAYDYGYYEGKSRDSLGNETPWKGKYVIVWKKEKGDWKICLDIWNRIN